MSRTFCQAIHGAVLTDRTERAHPAECRSPRGDPAVARCRRATAGECSILALNSCASPARRRRGLSWKRTPGQGRGSTRFARALGFRRCRARWPRVNAFASAPGADDAAPPRQARYFLSRAYESAPALSPSPSCDALPSRREARNSAHFAIKCAETGAVRNRNSVISSS